jgi:hypothetical protein
MTEIHPDDITAEKASASWKFDFLDTVNADPLANGECLGVIKAYLNFANASSPRAYCSLTELVLRTGSSLPAVRRAKAKLQKLGYMQFEYTTAQGADMFMLVNSRKEQIDLHIALKREALLETKREERLRSARAGGIETLPPNFEGGYRNVTSKKHETLPNTLEEYPGVIFLEGEANNQDLISSPVTVYADIDDDPHQPFPKPIDDHDAESMIDSICAGKHVEPRFRNRLKSMLNDAILTPNMATRMLSQLEEAA